MMDGQSIYTVIGGWYRSERALNGDTVHQTYIAFHDSCDELY